MILRLATIGVLGLLGLFGYFYFTGDKTKPKTERAQEAAVQVGETVRDRSVAGMVSVQLASTLGTGPSRFLHVFFEDGHALVYGLVPETVASEDVAAIARGVPGVRSVKVLVHPLPADVTGEGPVEDVADAPPP